MQRNLIISLMLLVLMTALSARADEAPTVEMPTDTAPVTVAQVNPAPSADVQQQFDDADEELQQTDAELARQQAALNDLLARQGGSSQDLAASLTNASSARQSIYDAQAQLYSATTNQATLDQLADDKRTAYEQAKSQADAAAQALDRYRQAQMAQFEASPAMKQASAKLQAAEQAHQQAISEVNQWLLGTFEYARAYYEMQNAAETARAQRAMIPPDPAAIAQADEAWGAASRALDDLVNQAIASDPQVALASAGVTSAAQARQALVDEFNATLLKDPVYQQLSASAGVYASAASAAADDLNTVEAQRTQNAQQIQQLQSIVDAGNAQLAAAEQAIEAYQGPVDNFGFEVSLCQAQIDQLYRRRFSAWRRRQGYARRLGFRTDWHDWDHARWDRGRGRDRDDHDGHTWTSWNRNDNDNDRNRFDDHRRVPAVVMPYGPQAPKPVVPYGPQPPKPVVPYGPQRAAPVTVMPRTERNRPAVVVPYGPQPVNSTKSAKSNAAPVRRESKPSHQDDAEHERAVMRQGPQPAAKPSARSDRPDPPAPKPTRSSRSDASSGSNASHSRSRSDDSPSRSASPSRSEPSRHVDSPTRSEPSPRSDSGSRSESHSYHESHSDSGGGGGGGSRGGGGGSESRGGGSSGGSSSHSSDSGSSHRR